MGTELLGKAEQPSKQSWWQGSCWSALMTAVASTDVRCAHLKEKLYHLQIKQCGTSRDRCACLLLPPHSPGLLGGDFCLQLHQLTTFSCLAGTGCSLHGWQDHTGTHHTPEISNAVSAAPAGLCSLKQVKSHLLAIIKSSLQSTVKRVGLHHPP